MNAFFDKVSGSISDILEPGYQKELPLISVSARYGGEGNEKVNKVYFDCPVYAGSKKSGVICTIVSVIFFILFRVLLLWMILGFIT